MIVYKYLEKKYLLDFKNNGTIHLNTLYNLRSEKGGISDEFEGLQRLRIDPRRKPTSFSSEQVSKLYPQVHFGEKITKNAMTIMPHAHVISNTEVPDAFVFCASLKLDERLGKKWDYDAYYKIIDPIRFAETVYWKLDEDICLSCLKLDRVKYENKEIGLTNKNKNKILNTKSNNFWDICFTKPKKFSDEEEVRIMFVPEHAKEIKPRLLTCVELREFCKF